MAIQFSTFKRMLALLGVAAVCVVSACGGSTRGRQLTRAELTVRANAICSRAVREVDWPKIDTQKFSPKEAARLGLIEERAAEELNELVPPPAAVVPWRIIVDDFRATGPAFRHAAHVLVIKGASAYPVLPLFAEVSERAMEARKLNITECARY